MMAREVETGSRVDVLWLSALLAGLGAEAEAACEKLGVAAVQSGAGRMCIDGGASALIARAAPGARQWEAHVLCGIDAEHQHWVGTSVSPQGQSLSLERRLYRGRGDAALNQAKAVASAHGEAALACFDLWHRALGSFGRIYTVGREGQGCVRIGWQIDRHVDVQALVAPLIGQDNWNAATQSLNAVHGFDLAATAGPWSLSVDVAAPERGWRLGSTRFAWALDDAAKRQRLARWIKGHGGEASYACALHDLLCGHKAGRAGSIGRAVEVDVRDGSVVAAIAYLGARLASPDGLPGHSGGSDRRLTWAG
jgi:hypothetical protein